MIFDIRNVVTQPFVTRYVTLVDALSGGPQQNASAPACGLQVSLLINSS